MHKLTACRHDYVRRFCERIPWLRRLLQYSFVFFLVKGLLWTAVLAVPLLKGLAQL